MEKTVINQYTKTSHSGRFFYYNYDILIVVSMSSVARNTAIMLIGSIGQKIISLGYFAFLARWFSSDKAQLGDYTAALAFSTIFVVFVDLGMNNILIRNAAQDRESSSYLTSQILCIKIFSGILAYAALITTGVVQGFDTYFLTLIAITGLAMLLDATHLTFYGFLRAQGKLNYEAWALAGSQILTMVVGGAGLLLGAKVKFLLGSFVITSAANVWYSYAQAKKHGLVLCWPDSLAKAAKGILKTTWPFSLALIFGRFYSYSDIVLLKIIRGPEEVAIYSTPSKISFAFQFVPLAFMAALYPRLSELAKTRHAEFKTALSLSIKYLLLIAAPISAGTFILAKPIIIFAFSDKYISSVVPMQILIISLIFAFISFPLGAALNASGQERKQTWLTAGTLLVNVVANLIYIPQFGATGAAWAALLGNTTLGVVGFFLLPKHLRADFGILGPVVLKLSVAIACMSAAVWKTYTTTGNLFASIIIGGILYAGMVGVTGLLSVQEIKNLKQRRASSSVPQSDFEQII